MITMKLHVTRVPTTHFTGLTTLILVIFEYKLIGGLRTKHLAPVSNNMTSLKAPFLNLQS